MTWGNGITPIIVSLALILSGAPWVVAILAFPCAAVVWFDVSRRLLIWRAWSWARRRRRLGFLVTSDSPHWREHIQTAWIPVLGDKLVTLNWSRRAEWPKGVERELFRRFLGRREFCPAIVILHPNRPPRVYRFLRAFKEARHGNGEPLRRLETEAMAEAAARAVSLPLLSPGA